MRLLSPPRNLEDPCKQIFTEIISTLSLVMEASQSSENIVWMGPRDYRSSLDLLTQVLQIKALLIIGRPSKPGKATLPRLPPSGLARRQEGLMFLSAGKPASLV